MNLLNLSMSIGTGKKFESSKIKSLAKSQSHDSKKNEDSESPRLSDSQSLTQKNQPKKPPQSVGVSKVQSSQAIKKQKPSTTKASPAKGKLQKQKSVEEKKEKVKRTDDTNSTPNSPNMSLTPKSKTAKEGLQLHPTKKSKAGRVAQGKTGDNKRDQSSSSQSGDHSPLPNLAKSPIRKKKQIAPVKKAAVKKQKDLSDSDSSDGDSSEARDSQKDSIMAEENKAEELKADSEDRNPLYSSHWDFSKMIQRVQDTATMSKIMKKAKEEFSFITTVKRDSAARPHCHACFQTQKPVESIARQDITDMQQPTSLLQSMKWLYTLAYCSDCEIPVHLNCLGYNHKHLTEGGASSFRSMKFSFNFTKKDQQTGLEGTPEKIEAQILIYKCDSCKHMEKTKTKQKPQCIVCLNREGFMKKVRTTPAKDNSQVVSGYNSAFKEAHIDGDSNAFVHQICAISFPEHFSLVDIHAMRFEMGDPEDIFDKHTKLQSQDSSSKKNNKCSVCNTDRGLRVSCQQNKQQMTMKIGNHKKDLACRCNYQAHAYCANKQAMEQSLFQEQKCYQTNQYVEPGSSWSKQTVGELETTEGSTEIKQSSNMIYFCMHHFKLSRACYACTEKDIYRMGIVASQQITEKEMVQCEYCTVWFHQICDKISQEKLENPHRLNEQEGPLIMRLEPQIRQSDYAEGKVFACHKCKFWNKLIQSPLGEGLFIKSLGTETSNQRVSSTSNASLDSQKSPTLMSPVYSNLINEYQDGWSASWFVQAEIWLTEHNLNEQIFSAKLWQFLTQVLRKNQVTKAMCDNHIKMKSVFVFNVDHQVAKFDNDVKRLYAKTQRITGQQTKMIKETLNDDSSINKEALESNKRMLERLVKLSVEMPLICDKNEIAYKQIIKNKIIIKATEFYRAQKEGKKPNPVEMEKMLAALSKTDFEFGAEMKIFQIFREQLLAYNDWQKQTFQYFQLEPPLSANGLAVKLRNFRKQHRGLDLAHNRYTELKNVLSKKNTYVFIEQAIAEGRALEVDTTLEISRIKAKVSEIELAERNAWAIATEANQDKPLQKIRSYFISLASQPFKTPKTDELLELWILSARWHALAKSFTEDKFQDNTVLRKHQAEMNYPTDEAEEQECMTKISAIFDIGEERLQRNLCFDRETIQRALLEPIQKKPITAHKIKPKTKLKRSKSNQYKAKDITTLKHVFCDRELAKQVNEKAEMIFNLEDGLRELLEESHQAQIIENYIALCEQIENFDFRNNIELANQKLNLLGDVLESVNPSKTEPPASNQGKWNNQNQKMKTTNSKQQEIQTRQVLDRVRVLKNHPENPIYFPEDLIHHLEAQVQISDELRAQFAEVFASKCADSFNKKAVDELRELVKKATKNHGLDMNKEKTILENISHSEDWFIQTFNKLKHICGQALHQIDFKDYQQLHSVLKTPVNCKNLLQAQSGTMDHLVGAAKNLHLSLLGAEWLFDVRFLLDQKPVSQKSQAVTDLSQLLTLYNRAQDLNLENETGEDEDEIIISENEDNQMSPFKALKNNCKDEQDLSSTLQENARMIRAFWNISRIATRFDKLFGTHAKIIATLERYEESEGFIPAKQVDEDHGTMDDLITIVDQLETSLNQIQGNPQANTQGLAQATLNTNAICPQHELDTLQKVRTYIRLNSSYQKFVNNNRGEEITNQELEISDNVRTKISYPEAIKLQQQAKDDNIPEDIPVLKRLNQSIQYYDKFKRQSAEYALFRSNLLGNEPSVGQNTRRYSVQFVHKLLATSESLDIEISENIFDKQATLDDLKEYKEWRKITQTALSKLEKELISHKEAQAVDNSDSDSESLGEQKEDTVMQSNESSKDVSMSTEKDQVCQETLQVFQETKIAMGRLPVHDSEMVQKIQAFDWLINASNLLSGKNKVNSNQLKEAVSSNEDSSGTSAPGAGKPILKGIQYWEKMLTTHKKFLEVLPLLDEHPIIQKIECEIDQAQTVTRFVKEQKSTIKTLQGKLLNFEKNWNYDVFRHKDTIKKIQTYYEICMNSRVDLNEETHMLKEWVETYDDYIEMAYESKNIFTANTYDRLKQIQRSIYLSPIDFGDLYTTISRRLEVANQIKHDIKCVTEEVDVQNKNLASAAQKQSVGNSLLSAAATDHLGMSSLNIGKHLTTPMLCGGNPIHRVKFSRVEIDFKHFMQNCQIPGVPEIDRLYKQIMQSRSKLGQIGQILNNSGFMNGKEVEDGWFPEPFTMSDNETSNNSSSSGTSGNSNSSSGSGSSGSSGSGSSSSDTTSKKESSKGNEQSQLIEQKSVVIEKEKVFSLDTLRECRSIYQTVEINMGQEELGVRVEMWKGAVHLVFKQSLIENPDSLQRQPRLIDLDQFKVLQFEFSKLVHLCKKAEYKSVLNPKEDKLVADYYKMRSRVSAMVTKIKECKTRKELEEAQINESLAPALEHVDFTQLLSDRQAELIIVTEAPKKKRNNEESRDSLMTADIESSEEESSESEVSARNSLDSSSTPSDSEEENSKDIVESEEESDSVDINTKEGRPKRNAKAPKMDDHIYYDQKKVKRLKAIEREKRQTKRDAKLAEKEFKRQVEKQTRIKEDRKKHETADTDFGLLGATPHQDKQVMSKINQMKERVRENARKELGDILNFVYKKCKIDKASTPAPLTVSDIELDIHSKHPTVDQNYRKKKDDVVANLKFFGIQAGKVSLMDIADQFFIKKSLGVKALYQTQPAFREQIEKVAKKRQLIKEVVAVQPKAIPAKSSVNPEASQGMKALAAKPAVGDIPVVSVDQPRRDSLESICSSPGGAQFSDDEGAKKGKPISHKRPKITNVTYDPVLGNIFTGGRIPSSNFAPQGQFGMTHPLFSSQMNPQHFYNPKDVIEIGKSVSVPLPGMPNIPAKVSQKQKDAILYDPVRVSKDQDSSKLRPAAKNFARPGSILRVWEGTVGLGVNDQFNCQMYTTGDIQVYQKLPELPYTFSEAGKCNQMDVMKYFAKLHKEKQKLLTGWIVRKNFDSQDNSDRYCRHFEHLESKDKISKLQLFNDVSMYIVPMNTTTKPLCKKMGVWPLKLNKKDKDVETADPEEETHYFAYFCHLKTSFPHKQSFLNPVVVAQFEEEKPKVTEEKKDDQKANMSPINSEDDSREVSVPAIPTRPPQYGAEQVGVPDRIYRQIKEEPMTNLIKEAPVDMRRDDPVQEMDRLLARLRAQDVTDHHIIKAALEPIIPKIDGNQEQMDKLDAFIKEVIQKINIKNQQAAAGVKREEEVEEVPPPYNQNQMRGPPQQHMQQQAMMPPGMQNIPPPPGHYQAQGYHAPPYQQMQGPQRIPPPPQPHFFPQQQQQNMGPGLRPPMYAMPGVPGVPPQQQFHTPAPHALPGQIPQPPAGNGQGQDPQNGNHNNQQYYNYQGK